MLQHPEHEKSPVFGKAGWNDKRNSLRRPKHEPAKIVVGGNRLIDCVLQNLSETGACLEVPSVVGIPQVFRLMINGESALRTCEFRWALEGRVGVKFLQSEPVV